MQGRQAMIMKISEDKEEEEEHEDTQPCMS